MLRAETAVMTEIYVSTDVEADGLIPGMHSMLSFGSAAFSEDGRLLGTFTANLETLDGATTDARTMQWWAQHERAWEACRVHARPATEVMPEYAEWLDGLPGTPVFVGYPAAYDFLFVYWYLIRFAGRSPFSFSALDMKTLAMATLGTTFRDATKRNMPSHWFETKNHTHVALDDAIEQGYLFCRMLAECRERLGEAGFEPRRRPTRRR